MDQFLEEEPAANPETGTPEHQHSACSFSVAHHSSQYGSQANADQCIALHGDGIFPWNTKEITHQIGDHQGEKDRTTCKNPGEQKGKTDIRKMRLKDLLQWDFLA